MTEITSTRRVRNSAVREMTYSATTRATLPETRSAWTAGSGTTVTQVRSSMEFFLNGAELSLNSVNSGNPISMNYEFGSI